MSRYRTSGQHSVSSQHSTSSQHSVSSQNRAVNRYHIVIAAGGTGGHILPAIEVANALIERGHSRDDILFIGSSRGQDAKLFESEGLSFTLLPGRGISRHLSLKSIAVNVKAIYGLLAAVLRTFAMFVRRRPRVVVAVGGYASFSSALAAVLFRIPLVLVNTDAVPGLVNALFGRFACASAVAFPGTRLARARVTGTPINRKIAEVDRSPMGKKQARELLGLPTERRTIVVFGGSLGALRINEATVGLAALWKDRDDVSIYQVTGRRDYDQILKQRAQANQSGISRVEDALTDGDGLITDRDSSDTDSIDGIIWHLAAYEDRMPTVYAAADLVVCRSGAMTVAELAIAGVPAVLVPLPNAPRDHQRENAKALVEAGAAVLISDDKCSADTLAKVIEPILYDVNTLESMGRAASLLGHLDAALLVAEMVDDCVC